MSTIHVPQEPGDAVQTVSSQPLPNDVVHLQCSTNCLEVAVAVLIMRRGVSSKTKEDARLLVRTGNRLASAVIAACVLRPAGDLHPLAKTHVVALRESIDECTRIILRRVAARSATLGWGGLKLGHEIAASGVHVVD